MFVFTAGSAEHARAQGHPVTDLRGDWRAAVDVAGGPLRFRMEIASEEEMLSGLLCNAGRCEPFSSVEWLPGDSLLFEIGDFAAAIRAHVTPDSLVGFYRNVGNRGPRVIPFRAARGEWPVEPPSSQLTGRWDATFDPIERPSPRVLEFRETARGLEGTLISNTGDYGLFWGSAVADSFSMSHFDGSFVYMLTGELRGDTLFGIFHAGLTSQRPFVAVRATGEPHLTSPDELIEPDLSGPFEFAFPDLTGRIVTHEDPQFQGKIVIVDIFGTWCSTCHDAAPFLVELYNRYHERGLEIVGLGYEVTGDPEVDGALVARYAEKFDIPFPLLLAGVNDSDSPSETQPQLDGSIAFPTTIFLDRTGHVRRVHAGFYGPATGAAHDELKRDFIEFVEELLGEPKIN